MYFTTKPLCALASFGLFCMVLTPMTAALVTVALTYAVILHQKKALIQKPAAPGPSPWPVLGSLHLMDGYRIPYAAFTSLAKHYGNVFSMKLGSSWCVVVNDFKSVKEVLITKGGDFDGRPIFRRFDLLFGGSKENSLAFCNNSEPQRKRRQILQRFTFPHSNSDQGNYLDLLCKDECQHLIASIQHSLKGRDQAVIDLKPLIMKSCANIFNQYFCSTNRCNYDDEDFTRYCQSFDKVFWEVNNGRAVDFLPWLMPFFEHSSAIATMKSASQNVRTYVKENIIAPKRRKVRRDSQRGDFLDDIMVYIDGQNNVGNDEEAILTSQSALYALEDILGGHSAVANIILRILFDLSMSSHQEAKGELKQQIGEIQQSAGQLVSLEDRQQLPWIVACMHETIRLTCSPIVPHQATQDSTIDGYYVPKDTVIFVNNHGLNMSEELWTSHPPKDYAPQRFLHPQTGEFSKPAHFQPFSMGKRSCMGYKMVHNVAFSLIANVMMHFDLSSPQWAPEEIPLGMLALPPKPFEFTVSSNSIRSSKFCRNLA